MRRRIVQAVAGVALVLAVAMANDGPSWGQAAGQFCRDDQVGVITSGTNGDAIVCQFNPSSNRNQWVRTTELTTTTAPATTATTRPATASAPAVVALTG